MREISTPLNLDLERYRNLGDLLWQRAEAGPDHIIFEVPGESAEVTQISTAEFKAQVVAVAKGLVASGIEPEQRVAILSPTRFEWALLDLAMQVIGAVVVPVYETSALAQVQLILGDSDAVAAVGASTEHVERLRQAFAELGRGSAQVWGMDAEGAPTLDDLCAAGAEISDAEIDRLRQLPTHESLASIVYTSGTTSRPKGVLITHGNFLGQVMAVADKYRGFANERANTLLFLPMAHVLARGVFYICLASGVRVALIGDPKQAVAAMATLKPTFVMVVPRVLQKILVAAGDVAREKHLYWLWERAREFAHLRGMRMEAVDAGKPVAPITARQRLRYQLYERLFYRRIRAKLGGRMQQILVGAAALSPDLALTFRGLGIPIIEGYGLTETTAPLTGNLLDDFVSETVGYPMPGSSVRIADDGEVLAKGPGVCRGYTSAEATAEAFVDGWFRTGDYGELDERGRLMLRGRRGDMIVTAGGKNMLPTEWERAVESIDLVAHAVVVGEGKPFLGGLIVLDPEAVQKWALRERISDLPSLELPDLGGYLSVVHERLHEAVRKVVDEANSRLSRAEQIRKFELVIADLTDAGGLVTPTLKLKRKELVKRLRSVVDRIYEVLPGNSRSS